MTFAEVMFPTGTYTVTRRRSGLYEQGRLVPATTPVAFTVDEPSDVVTLATPRSIELGDPVRVANVGGALPDPLVAATDYFAIPISSTTLRLAETLDDALAAIAIDLQDEGAGAHALTAQPIAIPIVADVQAVSGRALDDAIEGQRGRETVVIYTTSELRTRTPTTEPDLIAIDGSIWEVVRVQRYRVFANRWRAYAVRTDRP